MRVLNWLRSWMRRDRLERDLEEEIRLHKEMLVEELEHDGVTRSEARLEAKRRFGHVASARELSFDEWSLPRFESFVQDIRYAARGLVRSKTFTITAVLTLGIGLGFNTVLFTLFNAHALRPLAVPDPLSLYQVTWHGQQSGARSFSWNDFKSIRQRKDVFAEALAQTRVFGHLNGSPWRGMLVSGNFFSMLGAGMERGRPLVESDASAPGSNAVMVISHHTWREFFGGRGLGGWGESSVERATL